MKLTRQIFWARVLQIWIIPAPNPLKECRSFSSWITTPTKNSYGLIRKQFHSKSTMWSIYSIVVFRMLIIIKFSPQVLPLFRIEFGLQFLNFDSSKKISHLNFHLTNLLHRFYSYLMLEGRGKYNIIINH